MNEQVSDRKESPVVLGGWLVVVVIALAAAVGQSFGRFSFGVLLPAIRDDLAITNTLVGLIGAANVGAYLLGTMIVAWATARYRLLQVMRWGLILAVLGLLIAGATNSALVLAIGLFVAGIGGAFLWIPAPVIAADAVSAKRRSIAVGFMSSGIGLGIMFVSIVSGALRSTHGDGAWSSVYQIQFGIGLALLVVTLLVVRHQQAAPSGGGGVGGFSALQRMHGWLPLLVAYSAFGFMYLLVMGFLTTRLEDDSGWSSADASLAFSLMGFAMIFGGPIFTAIAQRLGVRLTLAIAFAAWPLLLGVILSGAQALTLPACFTIGLLFGAIPTVVTLYVVENTATQDYGPSFAAATLAFGIAQTIAPPIGGYIADQTGTFLFVFLLSGSVSLVGLAAALLLPRLGPAKTAD
jgi:predicted MFS family arabinose efflux permease